jgi:hypothetical protein
VESPGNVGIIGRSNWVQQAATNFEGFQQRSYSNVSVGLFRRLGRVQQDKNTTNDCEISSGSSSIHPRGVIRQLE